MTSIQKSGTQRTVMVCDDEPDLLNVYRIALRSRFNVLTATSGNECLRRYSQEKMGGKNVDALVLDFKLGDMTGDEVACRIRDMNGTKIILISAYEMDPRFLEELKKRDCIQLFLKKPVAVSSLIGTIEKSLAAK